MKKSYNLNTVEAVSFRVIDDGKTNQTTQRKDNSVSNFFKSDFAKIVGVLLAIIAALSFKVWAEDLMEERSLRNAERRRALTPATSFTGNSIQGVPQSTSKIPSVNCMTIEDKERNLASSLVYPLTEGKSAEIRNGCALLKVGALVTTIQGTGFQLEVDTPQGKMLCGTFGGNSLPSNECVNMVNTYSSTGNVTAVVKDGGVVTIK